DHILLRNALSNLINSFEEFEVIAMASNGEEVLEQVKMGNIPNLIILDLNMPKMNGYDTAKFLQYNYPDINVLVLTMYDSEIALIRLLQVGVKGFLKKDIDPFEMKRAMLAVAQSEYYYSNHNINKLTSFLRSSHDNKELSKTTLDDIEIEFLKLSSTDMTYKEIANKMNMNPRKIDHYRDNLFEKLDVKSRVGLAMYAIKNGLVSF
ncbi:MAG: response regulator transcription factor, partial [Chitinophagaceae bacterium]|nr:response regulator transcription factor [Chitinophagaceae bacterium]